MYKRLVRPILFLFNPEFIHTLSFLLIKIIFKIPLINFILKRKYKLEDKNLKTSLLGLSFKNKIGLAGNIPKTPIDPTIEPLEAINVSAGIEM